MKISKKNVKIFGATSIALFSLVAVFTATFAWFAMNKRVDSKAATINAKQISGRLNSIDVYTLEEEQYQKDGYYVFKNTPSSTIFGDDTNNNYVNLGVFDTLDTDHPILIVFALSETFSSQSQRDFYINGRTSAPGFLGRTKSDGTPFYTLGVAPDPDPNASTSSEPTSMAISASSAGVSYNPEDDEDLVHYLCRGTKDIGSQTVDCYPLSSVINFKCTQYAQRSDFEKTVPNTEKKVLEIKNTGVDGIKLRDSFVNFSSGASVTFDQKPTIYYTTGVESFQYVAMVVNYDVDVVTAIYSTYLGNEKLESEVADGGYGGSFYFTCDFALEVF